ncbi:MAG: hypothetical protein WCD16_13200 [Paracoccaceae bacterium]
MKTERRWMAAILKESAKQTAPLPWARGGRVVRAGATGPAPRAVSA